MNPAEFYVRMTSVALGLILISSILANSDKPLRWHLHPYLLCGWAAVLLLNLLILLRAFPKGDYFRLEPHESENVAASK